MTSQARCNHAVRSVDIHSKTQTLLLTHSSHVSHINETRMTKTLVPNTDDICERTGRLESTYDEDCVTHVQHTLTLAFSSNAGHFTKLPLTEHHERPLRRLSPVLEPQWRATCVPRFVPAHVGNSVDSNPTHSFSVYGNKYDGPR